MGCGVPATDEASPAGLVSPGRKPDVRLARHQGREKSRESMNAEVAEAHRPCGRDSPGLMQGLADREQPDDQNHHVNPIEQHRQEFAFVATPVRTKSVARRLRPAVFAPPSPSEYPTEAGQYARREPLRTWCNDGGGHFHASGAAFAIDNIEQDTVGTIELYRRDTDADVRLKSAYASSPSRCSSFERGISQMPSALYSTRLAERMPP